MRKSSCVIDDKNYYEFMVDIGDDVVRRVISSISNIYTASYRPVPEPNILAYNLLSVSMFFDTKYSTLYVTYKLDEDRLLTPRFHDDVIYRAVNKNLELVQRDQDFPVNIVGTPSSKPNYSFEYPFMDTTTYLPIRVDTEFMWNITPGPKDKTFPSFVENKAMMIDSIRKNKLSEAKVQEYFNKVTELNKSYLIDVPDPDYTKVFKKYISTHKKYLKHSPRIVEDWRQFTIYINVMHDLNAEKQNSPDHDNGYLYDGERIKEYIRDWAKKHHKRY